MCANLYSQSSLCINSFGWNNEENRFQFYEVHRCDGRFFKIIIIVLSKAIIRILISESLADAGDFATASLEYSKEKKITLMPLNMGFLQGQCINEKERFAKASAPQDCTNAERLDRDERAHSLQQQFYIDFFFLANTPNKWTKSQGDFDD